jgi:hypothetical protein
MAIRWQQHILPRKRDAQVLDPDRLAVNRRYAHEGAAGPQRFELAGRGPRSLFRPRVLSLVAPSALFDQVHAQHSTRSIGVECPLPVHHDPGGVLGRSLQQVSAQLVQVARPLAGQYDAHTGLASRRHQIYRQAPVYPTRRASSTRTRQCGRSPLS